MKDKEKSKTSLIAELRILKLENAELQEENQTLTDLVEELLKNIASLEAEK